MCAHILRALLKILKMLLHHLICRISLVHLTANVATLDILDWPKGFMLVIEYVGQCNACRHVLNETAVLELLQQFRLFTSCFMKTMECLPFIYPCVLLHRLLVVRNAEVCAVCAVTVTVCLTYRKKTVRVTTYLWRISLNDLFLKCDECIFRTTYNRTNK
jgi:hypothetical protein